MSALATLALLLVVAQEPKKPLPPPDEESIPGLPDGEPSPLPEAVKWDLAEAVTARTSTRERINLLGLWRFAAVPERETPVTRGDMGWIEMPGHWKGDGASVFDTRLRVADGMWRGKSLEKFPWAWAERDLTITNAITAKWLSRRIFLTVRGPWRRAEVYVHTEPLTGFERDGTHWFEITESLVYPGTVQLSMRLNANATPGGVVAAKEQAEPYVGLELVPIGPRINSIRLHRDADRDKLIASLDVTRPATLPVLLGAPIQEVPLSLMIRLEDPEAGTEVEKLDHPFGTMPTPSRTLSVSIPWSKIQPLRRARFQVRLATSTGVRLDDAFAIEFRPIDLPPINAP